MHPLQYTYNPYQQEHKTSLHFPENLVPPNPHEIPAGSFGRHPLELSKMHFNAKEIPSVLTKVCMYSPDFFASQIMPPETSTPQSKENVKTKTYAIFTAPRRILKHL